MHRLPAGINRSTTVYALADPFADGRTGSTRATPPVEASVRTSRLHAAADVATHVVAVLTVAGLAGLAATISYQHMVLLAKRHNVFGLDAHAFPICVDGLDLICVLVLLADRRTHRPSGQLPWIVLTVATPPPRRQRRRTSGAVARRVPTSPDAYARWCAIWDATRHLPAATRDIADTHGVSLRTLQFIRAAGDAGHLTPPAQPEPVPPAATPAASDQQADPAAPDQPEPDSAAVLAGHQT